MLFALGAGLMAAARTPGQLIAGAGSPEAITMLQPLMSCHTLPGNACTSCTLTRWQPNLRATWPQCALLGPSCRSLTAVYQAGDPIPLECLQGGPW